MVYRIKKILVPVDLGESSLNALDTAVALAIRHKAQLQILTIEETDFDHPGEEANFASTSQAIGSWDIVAALSGSIQHGSGIKPIALQEQGNVSDTIIKVSLIEQTDLIVMGAHGASEFRDGFVGSNTYSVVKNSGCPVLVIPGRKKYSSFRKLLFPVRPVTGALLRYDVASCFIDPGSEVHVLGLSMRKLERETNVLEKMIEEIREPLRSDGVRTRVSWGNRGAIPEDVIDYVQQNAPDLAIITPVLDIATKPKFIGPHTQKIIHCLKIPILSIKKVGAPSFV